MGELSPPGDPAGAGALAMALCAKERIREIVLPRSNAAEAACVGVRVIPANSLAELCDACGRKGV